MHALMDVVEAMMDPWMVTSRCSLRNQELAKGLQVGHGPIRGRKRLATSCVDDPWWDFGEYTFLLGHQASAHVGI